MKKLQIRKKVLALMLLSFIFNVSLQGQDTITVFKITDPDQFLNRYNYVDSLCDSAMLGTLQWAIRKANDSPAYSVVIVINIPGLGPHVIYLYNYLPMLMKPITIDGSTQPGYNYSNGPSIIIDGTNIPIYNNCFNFSSYADSSSVTGIHIRNFWASNGVIVFTGNITIKDCMFWNVGGQEPGYPWRCMGIYIAGSNAILQGNIIGTDISGTQNHGCPAEAVYIQSQWLRADNCIIGGSGQNESNLIANSGLSGITIDNAKYNKITRNRIYNNGGGINLILGAGPPYWGNEGKTAPVITSATANAVSGTSAPNDIIEIFGSTGNENANDYLATTQTDVNGNWTTSVNTAYNNVIATATDGGNNTSGLSNSFQKQIIQGSSCITAIDLGSGNTINNFTMSDSVMWFKFVPDSSNIAISVTGAMATEIKSLSLFSGICASLNLLSEGFSAGADTLPFVYFSGMEIGNTFILKVEKNQSQFNSVTYNLQINNLHGIIAPVALFAPCPYPISCNLIDNGDFETPQGVTPTCPSSCPSTLPTEYALSPVQSAMRFACGTFNPCSSPYDYTNEYAISNAGVSPFVNLVGDCSAETNDHNPSGNNYFFYGDAPSQYSGQSSPYKSVAWSQTVPVIIGQCYSLSVWYKKIGESYESSADIQLFINGLPITNNFTANSCSWTNVIAGWTANTNSAIINIQCFGNSGPIGYDFGIDDIEFGPTVQPLVVNASSNINTCFGSSGVLNASVSGGTAPYTYLWSNGQTTPTISGLIAGVYTVTVTDAQLCTAIATVTLTLPTSALTTTITSQTNVSCNGFSDGSATITASGGTPINMGWPFYLYGYNFSWSNGTSTIFSYSSTITSLNAGTYTVTVNDANGCTETASVIITQPPVLNISTSQTNVSCNGFSNGSAIVTVSGGTAPYYYLWNNGSTNSNITGLSAGNYSVTVTDVNGCIGTASVIITQPPPFLFYTINHSDVSCLGGSNGTASVSALGGTPGLTYNWSNGQNTQTATGLSAGTYTVTVTDANGCTITTNVTIAIEYPLPIPSYTYTGFCQSETFVFTNTTPFDPSYTFQWDIDNDGSINGSSGSINYTFNQPGYHPVKLIVTSPCGTYTTTQYVYVAPLSDDGWGDYNSCCVNYAPYDITDLNITGNSTVPWNHVTHYVKGTINIEQGSKLIITNQSDIHFGPVGKIVVNPGATLEISGNSFLRNLCQIPVFPGNQAIGGEFPPPCCDNMWEGIRVLGTNGTPHFYFNQQLTGRVIINGATIEDAHIAVLVGDINFPNNNGTPIYALTGRNGYIDVSNCNFINNGIDIKFLPFVPPSSGNRINTSKIHNCIFNTTSNGPIDRGYVFPNVGYYYPNQFNPYYGYANSIGRTTKGIEIWGQIIKPSNFLSNNTFDNVEVGITSDDASYNVSNSNFDNVARSIYIFNNNTNVNTRHQIINNTFKQSSNNAIEITSGRYDYIKGNIFGDPYFNISQSANPRSILLNSTSDFTINDNTFNRVNLAIIPNGLSLGSNFIGYENGGNNFNRTRINIWGIWNNSFLQTKCNNSFNSLTADYSGTNWLILGTLANQGLPDIPGQPFNVNTKLPAGNKFNLISPDMKQILSSTPFIYYHHSWPSERIPTPLSSAITLFDDNVNFDVANPNNSCLSSSSGGNQSILIPAFNNELISVQQYQFRYDSLALHIDNGQTNYLLSIINSMSPGNLKNTLLSHFPLSDTVIIATVFRNNPLAPGLLKQVLTSNCPVPNNVWMQINNVVDELPSGIASQIKRAQGYNPSVTTLTTLQRQIDIHTSNAKQLVQKIVLNYLDSDSVETAVNFLKTVPFTDAKMLVISSLAEDSLTLAEASSRLQSFVPSNEAEQDWKTIEEIYINLKQSGRTVFDMDSIQLSIVWQIAQKEEHNIGVGNARSILYQLYGTEFPFNYSPDFMTNKKAKIETNNSEIINEQYRIYPNPSSGKITIISKEPFSEGETINITDVTGKIVMQEKLPENVSEINLTILLSNGIYLCRIYNGDEQLFEKNIIIQK